MEQMRGGRTITLEPTDDESVALALRLRIVEMPMAKATITTTTMPGAKSCIKGP